MWQIVNSNENLRLSCEIFFLSSGRTYSVTVDTLTKFITLMKINSQKNSDQEFCNKFRTESSFDTTANFIFSIEVCDCLC